MKKKALEWKRLAMESGSQPMIMMHHLEEAQYLSFSLGMITVIDMPFWMQIVLDFQISFNISGLSPMRDPLCHTAVTTQQTFLYIWLPFLFLYIQMYRFQSLQVN
ncbi:hypothetical protein RchiOBHm_Chr1g0378731 [Rosa chinensis]|uniref:Uncharacterized protein n=1 Tax=Rosa chinensis TaxID=74649 RepID=A0A2P6SNH8_ROSCH|nr:hypothetical protein RchiOBHm_Chr1g0378731 [Rosa chinensis]